ncbi:MAG: hypothetical protein H6807_11355 [Planctomycetes bacterium]|nr:hypothetical protein [Planctomycetota bacterium]
MRDEYDFSKGKRGKYATRYAEGANVVVLEPDVAELFPTADAVNRALRAIAEVAPRRSAPKAKKKTGKS